MIKERELLTRAFTAIDSRDFPVLCKEIEELLAQPEQIEQASFKKKVKGMNEAETKILEMALYWMGELKCVYAHPDYDYEDPYLIKDIKVLEGLREGLREGLKELLAQPDSHEEHELGVETYFSYEDSRYPILVLRSEQFGSFGYNLDLSNGNLSRVCICHAYSENECLCGAWGIDDE